MTFKETYAFVQGGKKVEEFSGLLKDAIRIGSRLAHETNQIVDIYMYNPYMWQHTCYPEIREDEDLSSGLGIGIG